MVRRAGNTEQPLRRAVVESTRSAVPPFITRRFPNSVTWQLVRRFEHREEYDAHSNRWLLIFNPCEMTSLSAAPPPSPGQRPQLKCNIWYINLARSHRLWKRDDAARGVLRMT